MDYIAKVTVEGITLDDYYISDVDTDKFIKLDIQDDRIKNKKVTAILKNHVSQFVSKTYAQEFGAGEDKRIKLAGLKDGLVEVELLFGEPNAAISVRRFSFTVSESILGSIKKALFAKLSSDGQIDIAKIVKKINELENLPNFNTLALKTELPKALSELTEDATHRVVTDEEKEKWNAKVDKAELAPYAQKSELPKALSELTEDATHRVVTDDEKTKWNGKVDSTALSAYALKSEVPKTLAQLTEDATHRIVTAAEKINWNNKLELFRSQSDWNKVYTAGFYSARGGANTPTSNFYGSIIVIKSDDTVSSSATDTVQIAVDIKNDMYIRNNTDKTDGSWTPWKKISSDAEVPKTLAQLTEDSTHRVVTDDEKSKWNAKVDSTALSTYALKTEIPKNLSQLIGDASNRTVTDSEKAAWNKVASLEQRIVALEQKIATMPLPSSGGGMTMTPLRNVDLNTINTFGFYSVANCTNIPERGNKYASLIVTKADGTIDNSATDTVQMYLCKDGLVHVRNNIDADNKSWTPWVLLVIA